MSPRSDVATSDPGLTGAVIPTLLQYGERDAALTCAAWLGSQQGRGGGYAGRDGYPSPVETGFALLGLLSVLDHAPQLRPAAIRAARYVHREASAKSLEQPEGPTTLDHVAMMHVALREAAVQLDEMAYLRTVYNFLDSCHARGDAVVVRRQPTHVAAGYAAALLELGEYDRADAILADLLTLQRADGAVRASAKASWVSSKSIGMLAWCCYVRGHKHEGDTALSWLETRQRLSGGFLPTYGWSYFPNAESTLPAKWYLDAHRQRVRAAMGSYDLPATIASDDGRLRAIREFISAGDRVVEVGCGKGRFLKELCETAPQVRCTGVDIVPELLASIPPHIETCEGSLEAVPYPDSIFDVAFSVEAIEHSANPEAAVRELCRIAKPGGWVLIIDKQRSEWGRLTPCSWESWPDARHFATVLAQYCERVSYRPVPYEDRPADGLMMLWSGQKRRVGERARRDPSFEHAVPGLDA